MMSTMIYTSCGWCAAFLTRSLIMIIAVHCVAVTIRQRMLMLIVPVLRL